MDERTKRRIGVGALVVGSAILAVGVLIAHFTGLPPQDGLGRDIYPNIPRGWLLVLIGQLTALAGSQIIVAGIVVGWLWEKPMTWALANIGALLVTFEVIMFFGIIPNEWLGLTQGTFEWTSQKVAIEIPSYLVLNNEVSISYGAIKDAIVGGYAATMLGVGAVGVYKWQEYQKSGKAAKPQPVSEYGRPIIKGGV